MGKVKKRFIDPTNSQHFHVVHRSQRDVKCDDVEAPQYVLLPSRRGNAAARAQGGGQHGSLLDGSDDGSQSGKGQWRDHVNELGLPNDGYDYSRHLKTIGGGRFIAASGEVAPGRVYELSEDPEEWGKEGGGGGEGTIKPVVDAITLSADCMDEDMEAALFGSEDEGADEEHGGFEELNDDFILQAGQEPVMEEDGGEGGAAADGFDFEAHMARLIAKSEKSLGWAPARGWEEGELEQLERLVPNKGLEGYDSEDEEDVGVSNQRIKARAAARVSLAAAAAAAAQGKKGVAAVVTTTSEKERARVEEDFDDLLAEYSEDEIGELEDPAEEDAETRGVVEVDGTGVGGDAYIEDILDDFLRSKIASDSSEGEEEGSEEEKMATPSRGGRGLFGRRKKVAAEEKEEEEEEEDEEEEEVLEATVASGQAGGVDEMEAFIVKHEYLGDREPETQWDCESILSTCSNLDNHPSVIKEEGGAMNKKKKKKAWMMPAVPEGEAAGPEGAVTMVALSKKSGLPLGVLPAMEKKEGSAGQNSGSKRDKGETEEEKRSRKAAVKQARRETRQKKKELAQAFKEVDRVAGVQSRNSETAVARSVFQYS